MKKTFVPDDFRARNAQTRRIELQRHGLITPDGTVLVNRIKTVGQSLGVDIPDELIVRIRIELARKDLDKYETQLNSLKKDVGMNRVKANTTNPQQKKKVMKKKAVDPNIPTSGPTDKTVLHSISSPKKKGSLFYDEDTEPDYVKHSIRSAPLTIDPITGERRSFRLKTGSILPRHLMPTKDHGIPEAVVTETKKSK